LNNDYLNVTLRKIYILIAMTFRSWGMFYAKFGFSHEKELVWAKARILVICLAHDLKVMAIYLLYFA
jgi:hypothetical protein